MSRSSKDTFIVGLAVILFGILAIAFVLGLSVVVFGGLAMLLMNVVLPMFDVNYPLTYTQAGGIGVGIIALRALVSGVFNVTVNK